ncbi:hypothetical protein PHSC3_000763 [Chlamydiales bacterium STE3]|nr:hypothetical protein PHSC3_000763 [Chlamydiales bacterium STE3]
MAFPVRPGNRHLQYPVARPIPNSSHPSAPMYSSHPQGAVGLQPVLTPGALRERITVQRNLPPSKVYTVGTAVTGGGHVLPGQRN